MTPSIVLPQPSASALVRGLAEGWARIPAEVAVGDRVLIVSGDTQPGVGWCGDRWYSESWDDGEWTLEAHDGTCIRLPLGAVVGSGVIAECLLVVSERGCTDHPDVPQFVAWSDRHQTATILTKRLNAWTLKPTWYIDKEATEAFAPLLPWFPGLAPGDWLVRFDDLAPTTERCPECWGEPKRPDDRIEGGSVSCRFCNRTFTFNFMRDPGPYRCSCERAQLDACVRCRGRGSCEPYPVGEAP